MRCGEALPVGARFCPSCGEPVEDVPAPKKLEEPLSPLEAGAVPMVPLAPPPRATRIVPRAPRPVSVRSHQPAGRAVSEPFAWASGRAADEPARGSEPSWESVAPEGAVGRADGAPVETGADADATAVVAAAPAAEAVSGEAVPEPPADVTAALAPERAVEHAAEVERPKRGVFMVAGGVAAALALVFLVVVSVSWFGPFADRSEVAPPMEPASDGSIEPLASEGDEAPADDSAAPAEGGPEVRAAMEDYSWEELSQISALIAQAESDDAGLKIAQGYNLCDDAGKLDGTQTKELELSDGTTVVMRIAGFRQDERADGSGAAGISFISSTSVGTRPMCANAQMAGGWEGSSMRAWLNDDLLAELPEEVSELVVAVSKPANPVLGEGGSQGTTKDKLWLPSYSEVVGTLPSSAKRAASYEPEGEQYQLFADADVALDTPSDLLAVKTTDTYWWSRTPDSTSANHFLCVATDGSGGWINHKPATEHAVLVGFCL